MITNVDRLTESGCSSENKDKVCRSRGGESCAFDGAMIVLQPIADTAHLVHGPIACCGNSWEGRGTRSSKGDLFRMGFTTDMNELDIVYGAEARLLSAIRKTVDKVRPKAIFVYATCVSGLIGEDIETACRKAEKELGIRVIPVNAPGFIGPKNLGNRIAGEVLLDYVIGTGNSPSPLPSPARGESRKLSGLTGGDEGEGELSINLIGEYNIAGDLWLVETVLEKAGIRVLSRITGDATFEEITWAHQARMNVVVCNRALINVAKGMEEKYGVPYVEVSFFGKTEMSKALRIIGSKFEVQSSGFKEKIENVIKQEEKTVNEKLENYKHLRGKKAVLYTGGVKSWSFISALQDLGIEIVAVGTKKSTVEDEEKMKGILGPEAPLVEDVTPKNLAKLFRERHADILIAGGRNQYLAIKEGFPFIDVNQERHVAYAGYEGLVNLAEQISNSMHFYAGIRDLGLGVSKKKNTNPKTPSPNSVLINPLKHSQSIGAAIALQGVHNALPVIHGAQGCTFLGKVLLTKHFREPIALAGTKLFAEDVVMGSDEALVKTVQGFIDKNSPEVIGVLTSGLTEVKGDDVSAVVKSLNVHNSQCRVLHIPTPDYEGGLETGYAKAIETIIEDLADNKFTFHGSQFTETRINVLVGSHLTPADFTELREITESFGLKPILLPDLSALDGSRQGFSALAMGGTKIDEIKEMSKSEFTIAIGASMETAAKKLKNRFGIKYRVFESVAGLRDTDLFMDTLSLLSGKEMPSRHERQRRVLIDAMRDAHFYFGSKRVCLALEKDLSMQISQWLNEMGAEIVMVDVNSGDLFSIEGRFDLLIANSHAEDTARRISAPLYQMGFPVYKVLGYCSKITIGYRGTLSAINDVSNLFLE